MNQRRSRRRKIKIVFCVKSLQLLLFLSTKWRRHCISKMITILINKRGAFCWEHLDFPQNKHPECDLSWKRFVHRQCCHSCQKARGAGWGVVVVVLGQGDGAVGDMASLQSSSALEIWLCRSMIFGCVWRCNLPFDFHSARRMGGCQSLLPWATTSNPYQGQTDALINTD